jgi:sugar phosphate permease
MTAIHTEASATLTTEQKTLVWIAWVTYATFYIGRLNLSPVLPEIASDLGIGLGQVGILGTVFFWSYALGQIVNGQIGNSLSPHWMIFTALMLIAISNVVFAFQMSLWLMSIVWGINGFAQAMGWGPMLKILSSYLDIEQRKNVSTWFSMSFQVGTAAAWGLTALLIAWGSWRTAFWVPGIILLVVAIAWRWIGLSAAPTDLRAIRRIRRGEVLHEVVTLFPALVVAACIGFVYLGMLLWLPSLIQSRQCLPVFISNSIIILIPLIGILGMLIAGKALVISKDIFGTILSLLIALIIALVASAWFSSVTRLVFIFIAMMLISGLAGLILTSMSMLLSVNNRVSSAGGLIAATWSLGGGTAGTIVGSIIEQRSWTAVFILWIIMAIIAAFVIIIASQTSRLKSKMEPMK